MDSPISIRLFGEDIRFITEYAKEKKEDKTKVIRELIHKIVQQIRVQQAVEDYADGQRTIRESAVRAGLSYHAFLDVLARQNRIGGNEQLYESLIDDTIKYLG